MVLGYGAVGLQIKRLLSFDSSVHGFSGFGS